MVNFLRQFPLFVVVLALLGGNARHASAAPSHVSRSTNKQSSWDTHQIDAFLLEHGIQNSALKSRQQKVEAIVHHFAEHGDCDLCSDPQRWVFVLATGRSGSTTIVEMLNAVPGFRIAGENKGVMDDLREIYERATMLGFQPSTREAPPYKRHGRINEKHLLCGLQHYVRLVIGDIDTHLTKVIGFKEIRHADQTALNFFEKVFPCAEYIINFRYNLEKQQKSRWFKYMDIDAIRNTTNELVNWQKQHSDRAFNLPLEHFSPRYFKEALQFLGVKNCWYMGVVHDNDHGYHANHQQDRMIKGDCNIRKGPRFEDGM